MMRSISYLLSFISDTFEGSVTVTFILALTLGLDLLYTVTIQVPYLMPEIQPSSETVATELSELTQISALLVASAGSIVT